MNLAVAIRERYGIRLPPLIGEFEVKRFRIDRYRSGFAIPVAKGGLFGCAVDREFYSLAGGRVEQFEVGIVDTKASRFERLVWEIGMAAVGRGEWLSQEDEERLVLAGVRLEGMV